MLKLVGNSAIGMGALIFLAFTIPTATVPLLILACCIPVAFLLMLIAQKRANRLAAVKKKPKRRKPARLTTQQEDALIEKWAAKGYVDPNSPKR